MRGVTARLQWGHEPDADAESRALRQLYRAMQPDAARLRARKALRVIGSTGEALWHVINGDPLQPTARLARGGPAPPLSAGMP